MRSTTTDRADKPRSDLLFFQKSTSLLKAKNSNNKCKTDASIVTANNHVFVSAINRLTSSMSFSENPKSSCCAFRPSSMRAMSCHRANDKGWKFSESGSASTVLFTTRYLSDVRPISSAYVGGAYL